MLFTRNALFFREYFKTVIARDRDRDLDLNFIAPMNPDKKRFEKGFAKLVYANRDDVGKFLRTTALNVAADQQAIYELIQNADDCNSSFFSVSYNEKYLLCINNGDYFSESNMAAIINVGASDKEGEDIGTFGIGFKILHRLVGKDDGLEAIIDDYAGPTIFSWNKFFQLEKFINGEELKVGFDREKDKENAWLVKILYTCFPTSLGEKIRLKDYETQAIKFDEIELEEMRDFLKISLQNVNLQETNNLKNGSIFFLKLGEGKFKFIDEGIDNLKSGISYSFNFLNSLKKIYINGEEIRKQNVQSYSKEYKQDSVEFAEIKPRNQQRDIKFSFAFCEDYKKSENIANTKTEKYLPNFYNFFSMDEEKNGFRFLVHCNSFDMNNDRRKLQPNSQINEKLLPIIARDIIEYLDMEKDKNSYLFLDLYAALLLSKEPKNKPNINNFFFATLKNYLPSHIPTRKGYSNNSKNVKIKNTILDINPSDFGCPEVEWFAWWRNEDKELITESQKSEKLGLEKWNIIDLFEYAIQKNQVDAINTWIKNLSFRTAKMKENLTQDNRPQTNFYPYDEFLKEVDHLLFSNIEIVSKIKLFRFSDREFYSLNEIFADNELLLIYEKIVDIRYILQKKLGFSLSNIKISTIVLPDIDIAVLPNFYKFISEKYYKTIFTTICSKTKLAAESESKENRLYPDDKKKLFGVLLELSKDSEGKIDTKKIRDIEMFSDTQRRVKPLRSLIKGDSLVSTWLFAFKMNQYEDMPELGEYCTKQEEIYKNIILENWESIVSYEKLNAYYFYPELLKYYEVSKDKELLESKKLSFVAIQKGFKKTSEIFFNLTLKDLGKSKYNSLQDLISKVFQKELPRFDVFSYFTDKDSPLRITENQFITSLLENNENLDYHEVEALLIFAKLNKELLFEQIYIQNKNLKFCIVKHSKSVFQYFSNDTEVNDLLSKNTLFKRLPQVLKSDNLELLGLLEGEKLYAKVLEQGFDKIFLPIIEKCGLALKEAFLAKMPSLVIEKGMVYDEKSFEQRVLKLAIECKKTKEIALKITIYGKYKIEQLTYQDEVRFTIDNKSYPLHLSNILPDYKGISDIASQIQHQFKGFEKQFKDNFFSSVEKEKFEISTELQQIKSITDIEQFIFVLFQSKSTQINILPNFQIQIENTTILDYCFDKKINFLGTYTTHLKDFTFNEKIYPSELALETEKLPTWILTWLESLDKQEKLNYLGLLGVYTENSNIVLLRKFFKTGIGTEIQRIIFSFSENDVFLVNTLKWLQNSTFSSVETAKIENLKNLYSRINFANDIPLLYFQQIETNKYTFILEISIATRYYFENLNKDLEEKIFEVLKSKGYKLVALEYFKKWQPSMPITKIETKTQLDLDNLNKSSYEWDDKAYQQWKAAQSERVFIYNGGKIPYKTIFLEQEIYNSSEGTKIKEGNKIYICQSQLHDIRNQLKEYISADELIKLYQIDNDVISIIQQNNLTVKDIQELLQLKKWLERERQSSEPIPDSVMKGKSDIEKTGISGEKLVYDFLCNKFGKARVIWASVDENEPRYDFRVLSENSKTVLMYIDAKASITSENASDKVPILIRTRAWNFFKENKEGNFHIARVFNVNNATYEDVKLIQIQMKDL